MTRTIVVVGYGPGISRSVAERFGQAGFRVALVGRTRERLEAAVPVLAAKGIDAAAFVADAGDPDAISTALARVSAEFGPIGILHWNAYGYTGDTKDLLNADPGALRGLLDVPVIGLLAAVRQVLPDLKAAGNGAVLITNGGFGLLDARMDALAVRIKVMGVALANGAKHKLAGLLAEELRADGVYVGEVMVSGEVKGEGPARSDNAIEGETVADAFWTLFTQRTETRALVSQQF